MGMDRLSDTTRQEMEDLAREYSSIDEFLKELARYGDLAWHNARRDAGHDMLPHEHLAGSPAAKKTVRRKRTTAGDDA